jgi:hypothetical protein
MIDRRNNILANTGNTKNYNEYEKEKKSRRRLVLVILLLLFVAFCTGMWVGYNYYPAIRKFVGRTARAPLEGMKDVLEGATTFASKEELLGAVEGNEDFSPNEKKRLMDQVEGAYRVKEEYEGPNKATVEQLWDDARRLYEQARENDRISTSELRNVVGKLNEATEAAE